MFNNNDQIWCTIVYTKSYAHFSMESATAEREAKDASKREEEVENEEENTE